MRVFTKQRRAFVVRVRTFPEAGRLATVLPRSEYRKRCTDRVPGWASRHHPARRFWARLW